MAVYSDLLKLRIKTITEPKDKGGMWDTEPGAPSDRGPKPTAPSGKTFGQKLGSLTRRKPTTGGSYSGMA